MQTKTHTLISPSIGTTRNILSFHYGPGGGEKIYIQSSLHADELPGMLVAWRLRRLLAEFEAAGKLHGEVVIVPVSNPIGLNQNMHGTLLGRFELNSGHNFNRNFHDLAALIAPRIEGRLSGDSNANKLAVRRAMRDALDEQNRKPSLSRNALRCKSSLTMPMSCSTCIVTSTRRCTSTPTRISGTKSSRLHDIWIRRRRCWR